MWERYFVSYAWADEDNPKREEKVDALCDEAKQRGVEIIRDKTTLGRGELISNFMRLIGEGDRVFVFISDKYLRSPYCMFELFEIWRNSRQDSSEFVRRVRFFTVDGTSIAKPGDWLEYAKFWRKECDELRRLIAEVGVKDAGEEAIKRFRLLDLFSGHVADILAIFADVVQPRTFEDFVEYGFRDPSPSEKTVQQNKFASPPATYPQPVWSREQKIAWVRSFSRGPPVRAGLVEASLIRLFAGGYDDNGAALLREQANSLRVRADPQLQPHEIEIYDVGRPAQGLDTFFMRMLHAAAQQGPRTLASVIVSASPAILAGAKSDIQELIEELYSISKRNSVNET